MSFPVDVTSLTATYHGLGRYLLLQAKGQIPGVWFTPFFQQEELLGGLKFSVRAFAGGLGPHPEKKPFDIQEKLPINLPIPGFNNKTVTVETASKTWNVEVVYVEWPGPEEPGNDTKDLTSSISQTGFQPTTSENPASNAIHFGPGSVRIPGSVLPPIRKWLPAGAVLTLSAKIPPSNPGVPGGRGSKVDISFNKQFFKLVNASVCQGDITWELKWNKLPTMPGGNPQLVDVTATTWQGGVGPEYPPNKVIQGYVVSFIVLEEDKE